MIRWKKQASRIVVVWAVGWSVGGCHKLPEWNSEKPEELAVQSEGAGDYPKAVRLYESSLDGTSATANVHFRLALIYDTKLKDPVSALHHYRRCQRMDPTGPFAKDSATAVGRIERDVVVQLGEGGLMPRAEAVRLRNENTQLRQQIATLRGERTTASKGAPAATDSKGFSKVGPTREAEKAVGGETRTYTVQKGDTLAAISRKFYNTSNRWKDILDANQNQLGGGTAIREGQVLIIP